MRVQKDVFADFPPEREEKLKNIWRFCKFDTMWYRSNVWVHAHRVSWIVEELAPIAKKYHKNFDGEKARILALVHDDAEIITGDIQAGNKARMSGKELASIRRNEEAAIGILAKQYPAYVGKYKYRDLLREVLTRTSLEAQVVMYADKLDGYCEGMHEVFAGNLTLFPSILFYAGILPQFPFTFPRIKGFLRGKQSPFIDIGAYNDFPIHCFRHYAHLMKPHTKRSLMVATEFSFYNRWRELIIARRGKEGIRMLIRRKE